MTTNYMAPEGTRRMYRNWHFAWVPGLRPRVEMAGMYNGKRNFTIHVVAEDRDFVRIYNPRNVRFPKYALDKALEMLGVDADAEIVRSEYRVREHG